MRSAAIYESSQFTTIGGLVSYGTSVTAAYHQVGSYVGTASERRFRA
jgi:hypothetical protein